MAGSAQVIANLRRWAKQKEVALQALGKVVGANMEAYAKTNKRWTNRTSMAVRGLKGGTYKDKDGIYSYIAHSVDYGIWLELANDRKYAILEEARDKYKDEAFNAAERIMGSL